MSISAHVMDNRWAGQGGMWLDLPLPPWSIEWLTMGGGVNPENAYVAEYRTSFDRSPGCWDKALPDGRQGWLEIQDVNALAATLNEVGSDEVRRVDLCLSAGVYIPANPIQAASLLLEARYLPVYRLQSEGKTFYERFGHDIAENGDETLWAALEANQDAMRAFNFAEYGRRVAGRFGVEQADRDHYVEFDLAEYEETMHSTREVWERAFAREPGYFERVSTLEAREAVVEDMLLLGLPVDGLDLMAAKTPDEVFQLGAAHIERMEREPGRLMTGPRMRGLDEAIAIAEEYLGLGGAVENPSLAETCQRVAGQGDGGGELGTKARADDPQR